jgi:hypothetical protein
MPNLPVSVEIGTAALAAISETFELSRFLLRSEEVILSVNR